MIRHVSNARASLFSRPPRTGLSVKSDIYTHGQRRASRGRPRVFHSTFRNIFFLNSHIPFPRRRETSLISYNVLTIISFRFVLSTGYLFVFKRFSFDGFVRCGPRTYVRVVPEVAGLTEKHKKTIVASVS